MFAADTTAIVRFSTAYTVSVSLFTMMFRIANVLVFDGDQCSRFDVHAHPQRIGNQSRWNPATHRERRPRARGRITTTSEAKSDSKIHVPCDETIANVLLQRFVPLSIQLSNRTASITVIQRFNSEYQEGTSQA